MSKKTEETKFDLKNPPRFSVDDFYDYAVWEWLHKAPDEFTRDLAFSKLSDYILQNRMPKINIRKAYENYCKKINNLTERQGNITEFFGQELELNCGDYEATDHGITLKRDDWYFPHPILISKIIRNISERKMKFEIMFFRHSKWERVTFPQDKISSARTIVELAQYGVSVTSENAKGLVNYLQTLDILNEEKIPVVKSTTTLGYIEDEGVVPYCGNLEFEGDGGFKTMFEVLKSVGKPKEWTEIIKQHAMRDKIFNLCISSSFASVLCKPLGILPFYVHVYGAKSGTGKTIALHAAASVWAKPETYIQSFSSTAVSVELTAAFLNQFPLILDELELDKDNNQNKRKSVYDFCEGKGKGRATKELGTRNTPEWRNIAITSGESPLTESNSKAGEINRVIELEVTENIVTPQEGNILAEFFRKNYGCIGKDFITTLYDKEENLKKVKEFHDDFTDKLLKEKITGKQAFSGATILTANKLINEMYFNKEIPLDIKDILPFLKDNSSVDIAVNGYHRFKDWVIENLSNFKRICEKNPIEYEEYVPLKNFGEVDLNKKIAYINTSIFRDKCKEFGYSDRSILSSFKQKEFIITKSRGFYFQKKSNGINSDFIALFLEKQEKQEVTK
jgi:hypothetical protein